VYRHPDVVLTAAKFCLKELHDPSDCPTKRKGSKDFGRTKTQRKVQDAENSVPFIRSFKEANLMYNVERESSYVSWVTSLLRRKYRNPFPCISLSTTVVAPRDYA